MSSFFVSAFLSFFIFLDFLSFFISSFFVSSFFMSACFISSFLGWSCGEKAKTGAAVARAQKTAMVIKSFFMFFPFEIGVCMTHQGANAPVRLLEHEVEVKLQFGTNFFWGQTW